MTGRVSGARAGEERRIVEHELTGKRVRDVANGQTGRLVEVEEYTVGSHTVTIAHLTPDGGGIGWTTAITNIGPVTGS
ncbi:hypothetical protein [Streptomyces sp. NPDC058157]|uniref:hypothetical protein n=1 Tax=Streptomyces sp. NPDC058157 TaxID=3346360 RepID=UPI0036ECA298